ncbi:hypothetical protein ACYSNM_05020 [Myroides sp. LJL116]
MRKYIIFKIALSGLLTFLFTELTYSQIINGAGSPWSFSIPTIVTAGADYPKEIESTNSNFILSGDVPGGLLQLLSGKAIQIKMSYKYTEPWDPNFKLFAKRTGGNKPTFVGLCLVCSAKYDSNQNYIEIPNVGEATLFTIEYSIPVGLFPTIKFSGVSVGTKLEGISVATPVDNYAATVYFTIESK